ncbi:MULTISPECIES: beta-ketoacyl-ACP synthase II [unclassified Imperialibacter]|uniref:beta-ketoacyl-ACP synthase II n=1 Tax=unclassified Imperialibacter TaxID=2629706 RepID=UPI00125619D8|nr:MULTISPECIES: beta-ketoacyl-ACP synthase II [unclassified Imperialibacter]CAD5252392.1 3-oxoacyl-(acyl-carrier-protein) synthase II [Imperialibacter sp. 89]CAD5260411.1 3-oxoacyl-(acyl-carrier-protein) synthase II [Imperialibacter sp. 75]VVT04301.1 3-oxoacyl-(acyl-carrier-protein) synthase II [Imperialibacter sp. EC-SDR9]
MNGRRVVVTGLGALTPIGNNLEEYWKGLSNGVSGAAPITRFDAEKFRTKFACEVKNYDPLNHFDRKDARKMDPFTQYALIVSEEAIKHSGLDLEKVDKDRVGVIWGAGIGGLKTFQDEVTDFSRGDGTPRFNPFFIPKMIADIAAGYISITYGFRGPNFVTVSACASATNALIDSLNYIKLGHADVIVSGGSEATVCEAGVGGFNALKALSERNDDPATASRPFDKDRDGFVLGEGGACIILEELEHAKARGAKIYAEFIGGGMSSDAYHITAPHPEGLGAKNVMINALRDAGIKTTDVDYINVHGTSTPLGDKGETLAIREVFGSHAYNVNISSTKSMTGHLLGAAGAIEAVASIMAIQHQLVPPTINHFTDDEELDSKLNFTFNKAQARKIDIALSNTFGFGGHNTSIIFRKYEG